MSGDTVVAKRYAKALFEVAQEHQIVSQAEADLKVIVSIIDGNIDFKKFIQHPNLDKKVKIELLNQAFQGKVAELVLNTLQLLIERGRESILQPMLDYYIAFANEASGQADAVVTTPIALTEQETQEITNRFSKLTGVKIRVENVIDTALLGGLQVRIGDRLYDGSLSGKLARMDKALQQQMQAL